MNHFQQKTTIIQILIIIGIIFLTPMVSQAQSYTAWYNNAQQRIDTLRKGSFGMEIFDKDGLPYSGNVSVRMAKHEYPFGIAFDFYQGEVSMGNSYSTNDSVQAIADEEIYKTERWSNYLAYLLPAEIGKEYILTLKLAEIFHNSNNARLFNVIVEGQLFLENYDIHAQAGGKNIAIDTVLQMVATRNEISIEMTASHDNVAIKGIVLEEVDGDDIIRINCGGPALTTADGNSYIAEAGFFDPDANTVASKEQWMKAAMYKYFNAGVSGNSFKWSGIQPQNTAPNYTNFDNAVRWTQKVGWDLRAHTLLWGGYDYDDHHPMPRWVKDLPTVEERYQACETRITRELTRYKGIIKEYDVMNEPIHATYFADSLVGDSINWDAFKWAHAADPDAELYINEYNVEYNWGSAIAYRDLILKIKEMGGPVTGVGMQAHFWDCCRPNVDELVRNVDIVAEAGLPIKFTEYDYAGNLTQAQQASDFIKVLTVAFSHPSIVGMYSWGLDDAGAWRDNTGFFDSQLRPKLAADTLLYYTKTKWATNFDTEITDGQVSEFNAYYGTYDVEVTFDDVVKVFTLPLLKAHADSVFTLHEADAVLKGPQFIQAELLTDNSVEILFDKPISPNSLKRSDFKFFSNNSIGLQEIQTDPDDPNALLLTLSNNVVKGSYIAVSYFPGNLQAIDGSKAKAFGPEAIYNPEDTNVGTYQAKTNPFKVFPNPASDQITINHSSAPFRVAIYNSLGQQVYTQNSHTENLVVDVNGFQKGLYMVKMLGADNQAFVQKIIVK